MVKITHDAQIRDAVEIRNFKYRDKFILIATIILVYLIFNENIGCVGAQTRDPRFYSRAGVNDYNWPNPGDPDYR